MFGFSARSYLLCSKQCQRNVEVPSGGKGEGVHRLKKRGKGPEGREKHLWAYDLCAIIL